MPPHPNPQRRALGALVLLAPWCRARAGSAFDDAALADIDTAVEAAIAAGTPPGAVLWLERGGQTYRRVWGRQASWPVPEPARENTVYDVASLTKVAVTTLLVMQLIEAGRLELQAPLQRWWPGFAEGGVTVAHLLTHTSALAPSLSLEAAWEGEAAALERAAAQRPTQAPGTLFRYSDVNFILLGAIVQRVVDRPLDALAQERLFGPLGLADTGFHPLRRIPVERIAPTELDGDHMLRGQVHDPTARRMGGVAGHAGLFSTMADMARLSRLLLAGGTLDGVQLLRPQTVRQMTAVATPPALRERRGLGWDIDSPYSRPRGSVFPLGSYGHTGFTGCAWWIDPFSRTFYVLLSNRVHPRGGPSIVPLYAEVATRAGRAVAGFDFSRVEGALPPR